VTARSVAFQKQPDWNNPKVAGTVAWVFDGGKIDELLGSFNRWNAQSKA
jgi:TM2 domain-containing membrane protein YozV